MPLYMNLFFLEVFFVFVFVFVCVFVIVNMCQEAVVNIINFPQIYDMTASQLNPSNECGEGMKVKVVIWGWKKWNWPILMHIYDKQCEIMQKNQWKSPNIQIQCF